MTTEAITFDLKDGMLVRKMLELCEVGVPFTLKELALEVLMPYKTVEYRIHRMKKAGFISNRRLGRRWHWYLNDLELPILNIEASRAFMVITGGKQESSISESPKETPKKPPQIVPQAKSNPLTFMNRPFFEWHPAFNLEETTQEVPQINPPDTPEEAPQPSIDTGDTSMFKIEDGNTLSPFADEQTSIGTNHHCPREEKPMASVAGPNTVLKKELEDTLNTPRKKKKKKLDSSNSTPQARLRQRMKEKTEAEYNVTDMRLLYEELWCGKGWKGFAPKWTMKDKKHIRNLLDEQGGKNTVRYFRYVVQEWENIRRRYRIQGAPNAAILWGFRSSLLHEALNKTHSSPTLEYAGDENVTTGDGRF